MSNFRKTRLSKDKNLRAYAIGLAIGDGNLSKPGPRAIRLRITCDNKYPSLLTRIADTFAELLPDNRVSLVARKGCTDVSVHSNHLEKLLRWKADGGPKFIQKVCIPDWIKSDKKYLIQCIKGLIETDGSIYVDRKYKMVIFSSMIEDLATDVYEGIINLDFKPHIYKVPHPKNRFGFDFKYQVRLSKDVVRFLDLVKIDKS